MSWRSYLWALLLLLSAHAAHAQAQKPNDPPLFLSGATLVDVVRGQVYPDIAVVAEGGKITGLFFDFPYNKARVPANAVRVDLKGKYLVPGLMDLHVHALSNVKGVKVNVGHYLKMFLAGGVTTVRAMGDRDDNLLRAKNDIDFGRVAGPNVVIGSFPPIEQAPGFPRDARTDLVNTPLEAREMVRDYTFKGASWVKFYNYVDADMTRAVVEEAHRHGAKVFGHFTMLGAAEASRLGVDSLEHTVSLLEKSLDYQDSISMTDIGYYRDFVLWTKVNDKKLDEVFKVLIENKTAVVPTLVIQNVASDPEGITKRSSGWFDLYQKELQAAFQKDPLRVPPSFNFKDVKDQWKTSLQVQAREMARFVHMGGRVATGSDLEPVPPIVPGLSIEQELELFVQGGMTPLEALRASTIGAAEILGWQDRFGSIEVGKQADIVVIDGNPLTDIRQIGAIDSVVQAGHLYRINDLKNQLRTEP